MGSETWEEAEPTGAPLRLLPGLAAVDMAWELPSLPSHTQGTANTPPSPPHPACLLESPTGWLFPGSSHFSAISRFRKKEQGNTRVARPRLSSYHHVDGLVQALRSGSASQNGLSYGNEEVRVDVCTVPPEHGAFLHLQPSTRGGYAQRSCSGERATDASQQLRAQHQGENVLSPKQPRSQALGVTRQVPTSLQCKSVISDQAVQLLREVKK